MHTLITTASITTTHPSRFKNKKKQFHETAAPQINACQRYSLHHPVTRAARHYIYVLLTYSADIPLTIQNTHEHHISFKTKPSNLRVF